MLAEDMNVTKSQNVCEELARGGPSRGTVARAQSAAVLDPEPPLTSEPSATVYPTYPQANLESPTETTDGRG